MKIISLNTWGGRAGKEKLLNFFSSHKDDIDIFCLQEVWAAPYEHHEGSLAGGVAIQHEKIMVYGKEEISKALPEHEYFFHPHYLENYGLMMLVRKSFDVVGSGDVFVYKHREYIPEGDIGNHARNIQYVTFKNGNTNTTVVNFHGLWNGKGKGDCDERIEQSKNIIRFVSKLDGRVVLCGDFNLLPDTVSVRMLEEAGLRNLIREFNITSTRTSYYTKSPKFADYVFINDAVALHNFSVLPDEVSDHAPLFIEIE